MIDEKVRIYLIIKAVKNSRQLSRKVIFEKDPSKNKGKFTVINQSASKLFRKCDLAKVIENKCC